MRSSSLGISACGVRKRDIHGDFTRALHRLGVDHRAGHIGILIEEIWRPFLAAMIIALIVEAALCLPRYGLLRQDVRTGGPT